MGDSNLDDAPRLKNSSDFGHEQPYVMDVFEKMVRMNLNNRLVLHFTQHLVDVPDNIHALIVNDVNAYRVGKALTRATTQFQDAVFQFREKIPFVQNAHCSFRVKIDPMK